MLKFFRRIRKNLISNGKTKSYFKYAFGEIALVMIGILLALQVSNWNDLRKEKQLEKRYLSELLLDLKTDSIVISNFTKTSDKQLVYKRNLMDFFNKGTTYSDDSLGLFFHNQWQVTYSFNPITTTLDEMKSTGSIGTIKNSNLRRKILETYNNYTIHVNEHEAIYERQQEETWRLLFSTVPNLYTGGDDKFNQTDVKAALKSFEVKNRLSGNYVKGFNDALHQLQIWNKDLLSALREEFKKLNP
ncbi:MAG: DUF6090 family protein [Winogradskyella sp.]|nr:DUF6090 family protein [Winogradskyella sp.]